MIREAIHNAVALVLDGRSPAEAAHVLLQENGAGRGHSRIDPKTVKTVAKADIRKHLAVSRGRWPEGPVKDPEFGELQKHVRKTGKFPRLTMADLAKAREHEEKNQRFLKLEARLLARRLLVENGAGGTPAERARVLGLPILSKKAVRSHLKFTGMGDDTMDRRRVQTVRPWKLGRRGWASKWTAKRRKEVDDSFVNLLLHHWPKQ